MKHAAPLVHVVLLGDSILDNAAYTRGKPDVASHLRDLLGPDRRVTLFAVDGSVCRDIAAQVKRVPRDATHLALAVGGNDALGHFDLLDQPARRSGDVLDLFAARLGEFEAGYRRALAAVTALQLPTVACTIYDGSFEGPEGKRARTAVALFDDVILRSALEAGVDAVELRRVCTEPEDYANPIEPSGRGGRRIAEAIGRALGLLGDPARRSVVSAG